MSNIANKPVFLQNIALHMNCVYKLNQIPGLFSLISDFHGNINYAQEHFYSLTPADMESDRAQPS